MKQDWETYIANHREEFSKHSLPKGHEERFIRKLKNHNAPSPWSTRIISWKALAIAASFSLLILVTYGTFFIQSHTGLAAIPTEVKQSEQYYNGMIESEWVKIRAVTVSYNQKLIDDAKEQMKQLDDDYAQLRNELKRSENDPRIIAAMIHNNQLKINLLQSIYEQILEQTKPDNDETTPM